MPIPAAFCLFWALLLISLSLAGCVVSKDYAGPAPEQVLPRLLAVLRDPNPEQRRTAAQALGKIARKTRNAWPPPRWAASKRAPLFRS